jgi:hypothetical protein
MGGRGGRTECNVHMRDITEYGTSELNFSVMVAFSFLRVLSTGALLDPMCTSQHLAKYVHVTKWAEMRSRPFSILRY